MPDVLEGQVAMVSGSGRGIGLAIAHALTEAGAAVVLVARSEAELTAAASTVRQTGSRVLALPADITDGGRMRQVVDQTERELGPVTLLVNNAGTPGPVGPDWEVDAEDWWRCIEVSVRGALLCTQAVVPRMLTRGQGRIINVASLTGTRPCPFWTGTSVAKTALIRFSEGLAAETQDHGLRVFAIHPGAVRTALVASYFDAPDSARWIPALHQAPESFWSPPDLAGRLCVRLATGAYDQLSGRFLTIADDLDDLLSRADDIQNHDLYALRLRSEHPA
jgi:NAD(P)-dependent dehydrogenase (short-subunit alcohol dehydrogenase family)